MSIQSTTGVPTTNISIYVHPNFCSNDRPPYSANKVVIPAAFLHVLQVQPMAALSCTSCCQPAIFQRFAFLATRMEQYIQCQSRDLVDQAYIKIVSIIFVCLERTAQIDPKYSDIVLLENYAAFQNSLYDLANVVPTLAKFYHQASESYEQACARHINMVIFYTFEKLFLFARRIEDLMFTITSEEIQFQVGMSKADLRKMLKSSLSGLDKTINAMYKKLQKNLTSEELVPSLWEKCKKDFLDKYGSFVKLVNKIYPGESVPPVSEMRELLAQM